MKTIIHNKGLLHVETPNGIVNIQVGLTDARGRSVDSVQIIPDNYADENAVRVYPGRHNTRLVRLLSVKGGG